MKILLLGGCNWLGRDLMKKLLSEKKPFHLTWVDNLSSELSSRHFSFEYEYLKDDCFEFKYGDIKDYNFLKSCIEDNITIIYNIWNNPNAIIGFTNIMSLCSNLTNVKVIYTTNHSMSPMFKQIIDKKKIRDITGILYEGEIIGKYDIWNKRDKIDTNAYYTEIGNTHYIDTSFVYHKMESIIQFIFFLIIQDMDETILIKQPTDNYIPQL